MKAIFLTLCATTALMAFAGDAAWENLGMDPTIANCITWDDAGDRILVGTFEGFHYMDLSTDTWTAVDESGMVGREVYCIDAGSTAPEVIITGRANGFDKGYIDVSFDLGQNWNYYYSSNGGAFWALQEDRNNPGTFYCGAISDIEYGELMKTEDNGQTWSALTKPQSAITDMAQACDGAIYACGVPHVFRSEDGGGSWSEAAGGLSSSSIFYSIAADWSDPDLLLCSDEAGLYRTTDGGSSWTEVYGECCMAIGFCPGDPLIAAAVTLNGAVIGSTDGGETWFDITGDLPGYPMDLAFCDYDDQLYVTTMYDGTHRTPVTFTGIGDGQSGPYSGGLILEVHPNPVVANAAVSYSLPDNGYARLEVYDILGRLVSTLDSGDMVSGTHQTVLNASEEVPGVLFVRLTTENDSIVQKVLVSN